MTLDEKIKAIAKEASNDVLLNGAPHPMADMLISDAIYLGIRAFAEQEKPIVHELEASAGNHPSATDSGTPRVDAVAFDAEIDTSDVWQNSACNGEVVDADFARGLERDLSVLREALQFYADASRYQPISNRFVHGEIHDRDRGAVAFNAMLATGTAQTLAKKE